MFVYCLISTSADPRQPNRYKPLDSISSSAVPSPSACRVPLSQSGAFASPGGSSDSNMACAGHDRLDRTGCDGVG